jgi:rod shape-determining protein MreC
VPIIFLFSQFKKRVFTAVVFVISLILLFNPYTLSAAKKIVITVFTSPFVFCKNTGEYFTSKKRLVRQNEELKKKAGELSLEIALLDEAKAENDRLRKLLDFKKTIALKTVAAKVIAKDPNDWTGAFFINRGRNQGVSDNCAVCSSKGLLGKVIEAEADRSFVILITNPNFKVGGVIKGTRVNGVLVGSGGDTVNLEYIPIDADVSKGDVVMTSEMSGIFQGGIMVGEVVSVNKSRTGLYKYALVRPYADPFAEEVFCVLEK